MGAATQFLTKIMGIGPHVEPFAANDSKIDLWQADRSNLVCVHMNKPRFSFHDLAFSGQLIKGNSFPLDRGYHRRSLVKISMIFCKGRLDPRKRQISDRMCRNDFSVPI